MVDFIDTHREELGVEPIITVLRTAGMSVASSTCLLRHQDAAGVGGARRDARAGAALVALCEDNYRVYGCASCGKRHGGPARIGSWRTVLDVEPATLGWVHWHNTGRLHSYLNDVPPAEFEAALYDAPRTDQPLVEIQ